MRLPFNIKLPKFLSPPVTTKAASAPGGARHTPLPPAPPSKVTSKSKSIPSYLTSAKTSDAILPNQDLGLANIDISSLRSTETTTNSISNKLSKSSPDLSAAVAAAVRLSVSSDIQLMVRNPDGTINPEGVNLGQQLIRRFNFLHPTGKGFNTYRTIRSVSESLARELLIYGSCAIELGLGKSRLPEGLMPVSVTKLKFRAKGKELVPFQVMGSDEVSLDIPTFFYVSLDQDLTQAYSDSPVQAAIQPIVASNDFMNDLRRIFRRAIHPRQTIKIDEEKWKKNVSPEILHDPDKLTAYMAKTIADLEAKVRGLNPEDALVYFDSLDFATLTNKNMSLSDEYKTLAGILDGKMASGTKTAGIVLNHASAASQNIASTSSMLFVKSVEGAVQLKLNEVFSRLFTLALRLFGLDVVAEFSYKPIDLRPELELETFKAVKQSRVLELLSLGLMDDVEASVILTGTVPIPGAAKLSGTGFSSSKVDAGNPTSNTSPGQGSALNQSLKPTTPTGVKSKKKAA